MPRTKGSRDISHRIRHSMGKAMEIYKEMSGLEVAEGIAKEMVDQGPSTVLARLSNFVPKDVTLEVSDMTQDDWVLKKFTERAASESKTTH